jgi:hypothetical protein
MASATFVDQSGRNIGSVTTLTHPISSVSQSNYPKLSFSDILAFKVQFTTVGIEGYDFNNPPPIGIAVIGVNNYIL